MSNHLLDIKLFDTHALVTKPGSKLAKPVGAKDLVSLLSESAQNVLNYSRAETLRLPSNVYMTSYAGNILNLCMYFEQRPLTLRHIDDGKGRDYEIMMPNVVIHLALKVSNNGAKHEVSGAWYYCTPETRDNLPTVIPGQLKNVFSWLPFPNCYENFTLCYGRNSVFHVVEGGDLRIFNVYYDVLINSAFNNDLRLMGVKFDGGNRSWFAKMAEVYKNEQRFPYELIRF